MSSLLLLSDQGEGLSLGYRASLEDVLVKTYVRNCNDELPVFNKMSSVPNPFGLLEQFDFILADSPALGDLSLSCEDKGFKVYGCSPLSTKLLNAEVHERFLDLVYGKDRSPVGPWYVTTWWTGQSFTPGLLSFVHSRLMEGERGPVVGCAGSVSIPYPLRGEWTDPLIPALQKDGYVGPLTLQLDQADRVVHLHLGPYYDLTYAYLEAVKNLNTFLMNVKELRSVRLREDVIVTVRATCSLTDPVPFKTMQVEQEAWRHVHLSLRGKFCVSGRGTTISEARRRVYRTFDNLTLSPEVMYRNDVGRNSDDLFKRWECAC